APTQESAPARRPHTTAASHLRCLVPRPPLPQRPAPRRSAPAATRHPRARPLPAVARPSHGVPLRTRRRVRPFPAEKRPSPIWRPQWITGGPCRVSARSGPLTAYSRPAADSSPDARAWPPSAARTPGGGTPMQQPQPPERRAEPPSARMVVGPAASFRIEACGLRCWIAAKLNLRKALKRHAWHLRLTPNVRGNDKIPGYSEVLCRFIEEEKRLYLQKRSQTQRNPSEIISCAEEPAVSNGHSDNESSLCIAVIGATAFRNFITITLFGAVGTLISFAVISLGVLGLISRLNIGALDLGDYLGLYNLVFGEGVVNDATLIVLFNAIQNFDLGNVSTVKFLQFIGSFLYLLRRFRRQRGASGDFMNLEMPVQPSSTEVLIGAGLLSAYVIEKLYFGRYLPDLEVSIMMLMAYLSYMISKLLDFSGILMAFFCGIVMSHYTWHNVTESSRITTK
ncbi:hypothetical protein U9M48_012758, partial [Paspalum notatum var. saurae]